MKKPRFTPVRAGIFAKGPNIIVYSLKLQNRDFGIISIDLHVAKAYKDSLDPYFKYAKIEKTTSSFYREVDMIEAITVDEFIAMLREAEKVFRVEDNDTLGKLCSCKAETSQTPINPQKSKRS